MPLKKTQNHDPETQSPAKESSPKGTRKPKRLPFHRYYDDVRDDVEVIVKAIAYYHEVVEDGGQHINVRGNLETMLAETPGLAYFYRGVRTDAQQIRRWLETLYDTEKAKKFRWFHSDSEAIKQHGQLKITEIGKYVDADDEIADLADLIRVVAEAEHRLEDLMEGFEERRLSIARLVEIRKANLREVWIDPEAGDDNG